MVINPAFAMLPPLRYRTPNWRKGDIDLSSILRYDDPLESRITIFFYLGHYLRDLLHLDLRRVVISGGWFAFNDGIYSPRMNRPSVMATYCRGLAAFPTIPKLACRRILLDLPSWLGAGSIPVIACKKLIKLLFTLVSSIPVSPLPALGDDNDHGTEVVLENSSIWRACGVCTVRLKWALLKALGFIARGQIVRKSRYWIWVTLEPDLNKFWSRCLVLRASYGDT